MEKITDGVLHLNQKENKPPVIITSEITIEEFSTSVEKLFLSGITEEVMIQIIKDKKDKTISSKNNITTNLTENNVNLTDIYLNETSNVIETISPINKILKIL